MSLILMTPKGSQHGLRTPNEDSFLSKSQTYEFVQIKFGVFGVLLANLTSLILVLWVSCSCFPLINHYFYKKMSLNAKIYIPSTLNIDQYTLAHTIDCVCVCSKILNHGLNNGLKFFTCQVSWVKKHSKSTRKFRVKM